MYQLYARPSDRLKELLSPTRRVYHHPVWALRDVSLEIERGTVTALLGRNGAGKSTFLKLVAGSLAPSSGAVDVRGRLHSILELGTGFQPNLTGRQNAFVNSLFLGLHPWEAEEKLDQVIDFADIGEYIDQPLATYSSGMQARLAFAVITTLDPEILVLDEALATGDVGFADKCKAHLRNLCRAGCTALVATHDTSFVLGACDRAIWIDHGSVKEDGPPRAVVDRYLESLGLKPKPPPPPDLSPRPKNVLVKIEATEPASAPFFSLYTFWWWGAEGYDLGAFVIGDEDTFLRCVAAAVDSGFTPTAANGGWGPPEKAPSGLFRQCSPSLGPGGAAYLMLPVPNAPLPRPAELRLHYDTEHLQTPAVVSILSNGRFREVGRLAKATNPAYVQIDPSFIFAEEGSRAPGFSEAVPAGESP
jgi:ABC-type polysaccharide/polyol phosphate transport system ATPase subunit